MADTQEKKVGSKKQDLNQMALEIERLSKLLNKSDIFVPPCEEQIQSNGQKDRSCGNTKSHKKEMKKMHGVILSKRLAELQQLAMQHGLI